IKPGLPSSQGARVAGKISSVRGGELWIGAKRFLLTPTTRVLSADRRKLSQKALEKGKAVTIEAAPGRGGVLTAKQIQFMEDEEPEKEKFL
ncbi:MAG: hypothetical protein K8I02_11450, partial [Candidatus Methylomirabilis sp.]|nr:hypothetical protein [Deltaproteobacteria bacterium]